ncbi:IucA/IucC family protein [Streptomyces sp. RerS4]|uniref:IucA/IucC family protein n=1 Tax=Streptomyces sp. RerS4 TaxID=2942449 RepID=UPI00201C7C32|nr:IucA/IucC family protein [Streptomyces sp. RerS4]UQX04344.1 iron transporter [Streptomyces sp. RerS4]
MDRMEPVHPHADADAHAAAPLLNCLLREAADAEGDGETYRLRASGRLLRVGGGRRPTRAHLRARDGQWRRLGHRDLVALVADELLRSTGVPNDELPGEITDSRDAVAALLTARAAATPPVDPYVLSEQALVMGHPHHPAPKARGGAPAKSWLPYAPEAHARFPLELLALREDQTVEEGGRAAADAVDALAGILDGPRPPAGYVLLPAHPWQLDLVAGRPEIGEAFADGRLLRLGPTRLPVWPTASVRTVYAPDAGADLFAKFSLDVRITNDIRRLWRHDLLKLRRTDAAVVAAFADLRRRTGSSALWLADRGYRTARFAFEELAVLVRDGLRAGTVAGATPLLAAALAEGFPGNPAADAADPAAWWRAYLRHVVPPVLDLFARHGIVLEAHLQNCLVAVDDRGLPVQALFRDAEGVKLPGDMPREAAWQRLVYCLVVNHLAEVAGALTQWHPHTAELVWPAVREEFLRYDRTYGLPEIAGLLRSPSLPAKTNLLLRWTRADGADARYLPLPNPLRGPAAP